MESIYQIGQVVAISENGAKIVYDGQQPGDDELAGIDLAHIEDIDGTIGSPIKPMLAILAHGEWGPP